MEILFEIILEILFQIFGEAIAEFFTRLVSPILGEKTKETRLWPILGYISLGLIIGVVSIAFMKGHVIRNPILRHINLVVTPFFVGWIMELRGRSLERKGKRSVKIDSFLYGYLFALTFALTRYFFAV